MASKGLHTPVFPTVPKPSSYDAELESLCRIAAWVGVERNSEAPLTFSAMLLAFLAGKDPVSTWFQQYANHAIHDSLFTRQRVTQSSLPDILARADSLQLPNTIPLFSRSAGAVFRDAFQIATDVAEKSPNSALPATMGARHVMSAYAFKTPPGHVKDLLSLGFDLSDWQTKLLSFLREHYSIERWTLLVNSNSGPNPSEMTPNDVAKQVPNSLGPLNTAPLNTMPLNSMALNNGTLNVNADQSPQPTVADTQISPDGGTLYINTEGQTAGTEPSSAESISTAPNSTVPANDTVSLQIPSSVSVSLEPDPTVGANPFTVSTTAATPRASLGPLVGRYTADDPDALADDLLNIDAEAAGFARIVAARSIRPPLAVGIFGEWGSGKTYFMRRIQSQVETLRHSPQAFAAESLFYSDIVQIRFNAWHYIETNLWASLVEYIFSALDTWIQSQAGDDPKRTDLVFNRLATAQQLQIDALEKVVQLRAQKHSAELRAQRAHQDYAEALAKSAGLTRGASLSAMLQTFLITDTSAKADLKSISEDLALPELQTADDRLNTVLAEARSTRGQTRLVTRSLIAKLGTGGGLLGMAFIILAFPIFSVMLSVLANHFPNFLLSQYLRSVTTNTALTLMVAATILRSALYKVKAALNKLTVFDAQLQKSIDQQVEAGKQSPAAKAARAADQDVLTCQQSAAAADLALNEANVKLAAARQEFESGTARGRLNAFVRAKVTDGDYAKHLGIIASIRKDFVQLASLMQAANNSKDEIAERQKLQREGILRVQRFLNWLNEAPDIRLTSAEVTSLFTLLEPDEAITQFDRHRGVIAQHFEDGDEALEAIAKDLQKTIDKPVPHFSRIVLYIDDLDRCPPAKVVDVLQAVHLLLCFPLFVVIVAVDARWVSRALHDRFPKLLDQTPVGDPSTTEVGPSLPSGATSDDYLEKIFQIPYWVRPMEAAAAANYVQSIAGSDRATSWTPSADSPERPAASSEVATAADATSLAESAGAAPNPAAPEASSIAISSTVPASVPIAPASVVTATSPISATELAIGMSLSEWEIAALHAFAPYAGRTPRQAIRFVNIYRLIKTSFSFQSINAQDLEQGTNAASRVLIPQLAIVTGAPYAAPHYFAYLQHADGQELVPAFFSELKVAATVPRWIIGTSIMGVFETLLRRETATTVIAPLKVQDLKLMAPVVQRYSFTARLG